MKKIIFTGFKVGALTLFVGFFGGVKAGEIDRSEIINEVIQDSDFNFDVGSLPSIHSEIAQSEIMSNLPSSAVKGSNEYNFIYDIIKGQLPEVIKKFAPKEVSLDIVSRNFLNKIEKEKGARIASSVQDVLGLLNAKPTEFIKSEPGYPPVVRIEVPDQEGQQCGIHALANLLVLEKVIFRPQVSGRPSFTTLSNSLFKKVAKKCNPEDLEGVNVELVLSKAKSMGLSELVIVGSNEVAANEKSKLYNYTLNKSFKELLKEMMNRKRKVVSIAINSTTSRGRDRSPAQHWTAASIVDMAQVKERPGYDPVVIFMDSVGNEVLQLTNDTIKKALQYISKNVSDPEALTVKPSVRSSKEFDLENLPSARNLVSDFVPKKKPETDEERRRKLRERFLLKEEVPPIDIRKEEEKQRNKEIDKIIREMREALRASGSKK